MSANIRVYLEDGRIVEFDNTVADYTFDWVAWNEEENKLVIEKLDDGRRKVGEFFESNVVGVTRR